MGWLITGVPLLLFCFIAVSQAALVYVLPEGLASYTGTSATCPTGYTTAARCYTTIQDALETASSGDIIELQGSNYTITTGDLGARYWTSEFLRINVPLTLRRTAGARSATVRLQQTTEVFNYGLTINADSVSISGIMFTTDDSPGIVAVARVIYLASNGSFTMHPLNSAWLSSPQGMLIRSPSSLSPNVVNPATPGYCITCFCGCGSVAAPGNIRNQLSITNSGFNGTVSKGLLYAEGSFGLGNITVQNNHFTHAHDTGNDYGSGLYHIRLNVTYVESSAFIFNHYGECVHPTNYVDSCNRSYYLPYYIDNGMNYPAPLSNPSNSFAYSTLFDAVNDSLSEIYVRGVVYLDQQLVVNQNPVTIRGAADSHSCCATIRVPPNLNPAFYVLYENLMLQDLTLRMGQDSGGVLMRSPAALNGFQLNVVGYGAANYTSTGIPITVNASVASLGLSSTEIARLLAPFTPATLPVQPNRVLFNNVAMLNDSATTSYQYAAIVFPMNAALFPTLTIENSLFEGAKVFIVDSHNGLQLYNNYFDSYNVNGHLHTLVAVNASSVVFTGNKFIVRDDSSVATAGSAQPSLTDNIFVMTRSVSSLYMVPVEQNNITRVGNNQALNLTSITASNYMASLVDLNTTITTTSRLIGSLNGSSVVIQVESAPMSRCNYNLRALYTPSRSPTNGAYATSANLLPGTLSLFSAGGCIRDNFTVSVKWTRTGESVCRNAALLLQDYTVSTVMRWVPSMLANNPILRGGSDTRRCDSGIVASTYNMVYTAHLNKFNADLQFDRGSSLSYVCPNYTADSLNVQNMNSTLSSLRFSSLEDAALVTRSGAPVTLCSGQNHTVGACVELDNISVIGEQSNTAVQLACVDPSRCCCALNVTNSNVYISKLSLSNTTTIGSTTCCSSNAIWVTTTSTPSTNITVISNTLSAFQTAITVQSAYDMLLTNNTISDCVTGVAILTGVNRLGAPSWITTSHFYRVYANAISNTNVGITNRFDTCAQQYPVLEHEVWDGVYAPNWDIRWNTMSTAVDNGIILRGVLTPDPVNNPMLINSNTFGVGNTSTPTRTSHTWTTTAGLGLIPYSGSITQSGVVLELNGANVSSNFFGTGMDLVAYGSNIYVGSNRFSDASVRYTSTDARMLKSTRGMRPLANNTIIYNDFCLGGLNSVFVNTVLQGRLTVNTNAHQSIGADNDNYGFYMVGFAFNRIATLYNLYPMRDPVGYSWNIHSTNNTNCASTRLDPDRASNEYILAPSTPYSLPSKRTAATKKRNAPFVIATFSGYESSAIGACALDSQPTPDLKACESCQSVLSASKVDMRRAFGCLILSPNASITTMTSSTSGTSETATTTTTTTTGTGTTTIIRPPTLPFWGIMLVIVGSVGVLMALVMFVFSCVPMGDAASRYVPEVIGKVMTHRSSSSSTKVKGSDSEGDVKKTTTKKKSSSKNAGNTSMSSSRYNQTTRRTTTTTPVQQQQQYFQPPAPIVYDDRDSVPTFYDNYV
jgi:hypothetical protein